MGNEKEGKTQRYLIRRNKGKKTKTHYFFRDHYFFYFLLRFCYFCDSFIGSADEVFRRLNRNSPARATSRGISTVHHATPVCFLCRVDSFSDLISSLSSSLISSLISSVDSSQEKQRRKEVPACLPVCVRASERAMPRK